MESRQSKPLRDIAARGARVAQVLGWPEPEPEPHAYGSALAKPQADTSRQL